MKVVLFANTDWYLYNFRRSLALALRDAGHELLLISPPGRYGQKLLDLGLRWEPLPMRRQSLNPFREAALLFYLWRLFRRERPDLVHAFTIKCAVYGSLAAQLAGIDARVNAVAGLGYVFVNNDRKARLLRPFVRVLLKLSLGGKGARLILQNPDNVDTFLAAHLVQPDQIRMIPGSGVAFDLFVPGSDEISDPMRVLLPSRLLWDKGLAEFIAAAEILEAQGRKLQFLLAGIPDPGNPASVPEETVHDWVDDGIVKWLGHVDDMPELMASVDVVVLPSYGEGLPKSLIEAAACARALITTDVWGCREVVTHEVDGLLVPVRDAEALAAAIARLQDDPVLLRKLGEAARVKALAQFDERLVISRTLAVYQEIVPPTDAPGAVGLLRP